MPELVPLAALITPFILWPIEQLAPFPHIIEELAKTLLILPTLKTQSPLKLSTIIGILFALSETVLYYFNILATGSLSLLIFRLALTTTLHVTTCLIISLAGNKNPKLTLLGTTVSIIIHYLYNRSLTNI